ncbi:cobalamin biosynthesis protein [Devosia sp. PTR5]|uniref:Cobalamin biosynthesis protein n=1 Tax=Devosia oryzisoli TaxID=2774138 RepID=A0A927FU67_9HYPH|nr:cobalamin biosynthesis protein [Devosia oryzisoli]MBD8065542.1 cobalamin biosynthesis protein [Devosia oryzisoli]
MTVLPSGPEEGHASVAGIVVGLGARAAATAEEVLDLIDCCLAEAGADRARILGCVTAEIRARHPALNAAAAALNVPLRAVDVTAAPNDVPNPSERVFRGIGVTSVAEAAALRSGPLLLEKRKSANATCALSLALYQAESTVSAASTLSTSGADA